MKDEYDIKSLNPRKNPYSKKLKKQITINIDSDTIILKLIVDGFVFY